MIKTTERPRGILNTPVKVNFKSIFKGVANGVVHIASGQSEKLVGDLADTLAGIKLEKPADELAYVLIQRALFDAVFKLSEELIPSFTLDESFALPKLNTQLETKLEEVKVTLSKDFLVNPSKIKLIAEIVPLFKEWLINMGLPDHSADAVSKRLPSYFVFSLTSEWQVNSQKYKPILEFINTPFEEAVSRESEWLNYFSMLERRTHENVFEEPFSLSQIYIPLRAYYEVTDTGTRKTDNNFIGKSERVIVDLRSEIVSWISAKNKQDSLRVMSGGPGCGKSSFAKILCAEIAEKAIAKPIYIPLHLIDPTKDVIDEVSKFVKDEGFLSFNPLNPDLAEQNILLVFDGLDELANQGKVAAQIAKDFIQAVERMVERRNIGPNPILVLISGRELVVQENETEFRRPKQILNILPYYLKRSELMDGNYRNAHNFEDHRDTWWIKYGKLTGKSYSGLPNNLKRFEIDEITAQPLLNYLVALSYSRGKLNFNQSLNLNYIYEDLISAVYERGYERRTYKPISHIQLNDFKRVLEEIGLAAWHSSDGRSTSVNDILQHCKDSGLEGLVNTFKEGAEAGVTKLLAAFFFRKNGNQSTGDSTFVFTHKSFGEYLTSSRIIRGIEVIINQLERRKHNVDDGFDLIEGLAKWVKLVGMAEMSQYVFNFLEREVLQRDDEKVRLWKGHLISMLNYVIDNGMPMEKVSAKSFFDSTRQQSNASVTLVMVLNSCSRKLAEIAKLDFKSDISFGSFLKRVCPQRSGPASPLLYKYLSYFDFSYQCFDLIDLYSANLSYTKWEYARLHYAQVWQAHLIGADMSRAILIGSKFTATDFTDAKLVGAYCSEAEFDRAIFSNTNLDNADLSKCTITGARFYPSTSLVKTNISRTRASVVQKRTADFSKAESKRENSKMLAELEKASTKLKVPPH